MNRRDFLKWLAGLPAVYWPLLAYFERLFWTPKLIWTPSQIIIPQTACDRFTEFLCNQAPRYDELIIKDIRLTDSWIGQVSTGTFPDLHDGWQRIENGLLIPSAP